MLSDYLIRKHTLERRKKKKQDSRHKRKGKNQEIKLMIPN